MSRRSKKTITNRNKVLITVVILAICLFVIHRFNFLTKSAAGDVTSVEFTESGTDNNKKVSLEYTTDSDGKKYVILPEKIEGYFVEKYIITTDNPIATYNTLMLNNSENDEIKEVINTNEIKNNTISDPNSNNIDSNIAANNTVTNETKDDTNTVENIINDKDDSNTTNTQTENVVKENVSNEVAEDLKTVSAIDKDLLTSQTDDLIQKIETDNTVSDNTVTGSLTNSLISDTTKNIISNTVSSTNTISDVTNTVSENKVSNTATNESIKDFENTSVENNSNLTLDNVTEDQEDTKSELNASLEDIKDLVGMDGIFTDYQPGEKIYLDDDSISNNSASLEVVYQTKEINGVTLYNRELKEQEVTLTGYIPKDYFLRYSVGTANYYKEMFEGVKEFELATPIVGYDIEIVNSEENFYQPKDYNQAVTVKVESTSNLGGKLDGKSAEVVHIKESDTDVVMERIALIDKTTNSIEFLADEFSEYAVLAYNPITEDIVTIDDYESDYNYYMGRNYTDDIAGNNLGKYKDSNLAKVKINYYSYDYNKNLYGNNDLETTETWSLINTAEAGNYVNYTVRLVINAPSGKMIDKNKSWFMTFDLPSEDFSPEQTKAVNGAKLQAVVADDTTVTMTGANLTNWTENTIDKKYTVDIVLSFVRKTRVVILDPDSGAEITLDGLIDPITGDVIDPEPYVDPTTGETVDPEPTVMKNATGAVIVIETGETIGIVDEVVIYHDLSSANNLDIIANEKFLVGYVSVLNNERQVLFSYTKCMPITNGKVTFELIDNPYTYRPAGYGFDGWISHENYTFSFDNQTKMQSLTANVDANNEVTINLYVNWRTANIVFLNADSGRSGNNGKTITTPKQTIAQAQDVLEANFITATKASDRELNIVVFLDGTITNWTGLNVNNKAFTLTSAYNGVDYRNQAQIRVRANATMYCDAQFEFLNMHYNSSSRNFNNNGYGHTDGDTNLNYYIVGNTYNIRFGRGMVPINGDGTAENDATYRQLQGGANTSSPARSKYRLVVETGKYSSIHCGRASYGSTYGSNGQLILGNDYDRVKGDNTQFQVYHRIAGRTATGRSNLRNGDPSIKMTIKSGTIGRGCFDSRDDSYTYSGIYVGVHSTGSSYGEYSYRELIVEGGDISNIIGGLGVSSSSPVETRIYVKGGLVQNIVGGAGVTQTYGDRKIQVTGGAIAYSVSGGSNGWLATTTSDSGNNGRLTGNTLIYVGGNAIIGTRNITDELYYVKAGCVSGAGNGNYTCRAVSGKVNSSHIIVDGDAVINNSVYGGGNYGIVGYSGAGEPTSKKNDAANVVKVDIYGGTIKQDVYAGANQSGIEGSVRIVKEDGRVEGAIYGGSNTSGIVDGASLIYVQGGVNGIEGTTKDVIFGGGKGSGTRISQRTYVAVNDLKNDLKIYGNIYGGSALGDVRESTEVVINDYPDLPTTTLINGNIYGGGKGDGTNSADTTANVLVTVDGGNYSGTSVYGGCNVNGTIGGNLDVKIGQTTPTRLNEVYGGGNQAQITTATNYVYVNLYKNAKVVNAFNGGNSAGIAGTQTQTPRYIKAIGATIGNLYGGSNQTGNLTQSFVYASENATISNVYGGGYGQNAKITGDALVNIQNSSIKENVYGGGNAGSVGGATDVDITSTIVDGSVYAAGKGSTASVAKNAVLDINSSTVWENIYGGGKEGPVTQNTDINVVNTNVGKCIYAGGEGESASVNGKTLADINGSTIAESVYGGGNAAQVVGTTELNITNGTWIDDCVYGGGKSANIASSDIEIENSEITNNVYGGGEEGKVLTNSTKSTNIKIEESNAGNVFGGGKGRDASVAGTTNIEVKSSTIHKQTDTQGNVYGGGDLGAVNGNTIINIVESTNILDSVYGGGNAADVAGKTSVAVDDSSVKGNVYGGGNAGAVYGTGVVGNSTAVSVLSSTVDKSVFGGGNQGEVTGNTSVIVSEVTTGINSVVRENIYGGGNEADVNGTTVSVAKKTLAKNVYGGGNLGEVNENTTVIIDDSQIENNVYGGGAGSSEAADGTKGKVAGNVSLTIRNASTINNQIFGAGQGVTAVVAGDVVVDFKENSSVGNDIYGGGDNGPVNGKTELYISSGNVGGSAYAAGNGTTALVSEKSYLGVEGTSTIAKSVFGGGNAAETGEKYVVGTGEEARETGDSLVIVDIAGATIGENVYGGANSSVIFGSTTVNIGREAINNYYTKLQNEANANGTTPVATKPRNYAIGKIEIGGTIFGGGEQMDPTKEFNYDTISVTEKILINIDGKGYETSATDTNTFNFYESVFGSGNASSAYTNGDIYIRNYGSQDKPKRIISLQRATEIMLDNTSMLLNGTTDSTSAHPEGLFALNRINHLTSKNNTTLYLVNGANLLAHYSSMVGEDGAEVYADVKITDTVTGENGNTYEVVNGKIYDGDDIEYYVANGAIYKPNTTGIGEDEEITKIANISYATTIEKNVDNRIYMYSGRNLNISDDQYVTSKYGDVKGMTFFGIFRSNAGEEGTGSDNVHMGMYNPSYTVGGDVEWNDRNFNRSYVLGLHERNPEQDIAKDGFYTVYEKLGVELDDNDVLTEENYASYNATSYVSYITPTPKDDVYYMWYAGPDDEIFYYSFTLTASKHSTFGTKELSLLGISYENAVLTLSSVDASLIDGVGLYDKNTIPNINTDQDAANDNFGLTMKTSTSGWSMTGSTDILVEPVTETNPVNNASYEGTSKYTIENLKTTPAFMFFLYHSNNITEARELGTVQVNMNLSYWKDALNRGNAKVIIDAILLSEVYEDTGYNGAITPGANYDLFANTVTNITTKSSFSTYFEFAQDNFSQLENVKDYYEDSYRVITTEYAFPAGTTITMIDRWDKNNPDYYYYTVTEADHAAGKVEYRLSDFVVMGSSNEKFDEKESRKHYRITENGLDYQYENFIFISNFENAQFPALPDGEIAITHDQHFRIYLKAMVDGREEILYGLLDDQIDSIIYGIYDTESTIDIDAEISKSRVFLGNEVFLNVNTIYDVKKGEQSVTIYDTRYFDKKLGVKLTFYKKNDDTGVYEVVNGANLLGTYFELDGEKYYPRADGTTRIKIAELVSNASSAIKIGTENSSLATGEYQIKIESFGSADGIYYGVEASATAWVSLELINDVYGLNSTLPEEQVIIDKTTGYTLDAATGKMNEAGHNELNFNVEYLSGLNHPYITVSLYRREYDETMNNPYQNAYNLVDLADYVSDDLELPLEINQEYDEEDQEFVDSIKQFNREYKAIDTETIKASVLDNTVSVTLKSNYNLKENLKTGTYKVVFKLYDVSDEIAKKQEVNDKGEISEKPLNVKEYMYIGDTFSYIIIK